MKNINNPCILFKPAEVRCLTNDHQAHECTDGHQHIDNVGVGCENHDCRCRWQTAVHHFPSIRYSPRPSLMLTAKTQNIMESHWVDWLNGTTKINHTFPFAHNLHHSNYTGKKKIFPLYCSVIKIFHKHYRCVDWNMACFSSEPITLRNHPSCIQSVFKRLNGPFSLSLWKTKQCILSDEASVLVIPLFMSSLCGLVSSSSTSIVINQ